MRQVPTERAVPIGIVGSGRLARHLLHYFNLVGATTRQWARSHPCDGPVEGLAGCDTIVLAIRDAAIVPFIEECAPLRHKHLVHCAGGLVTSAAHAAHPLMTFGPELYDLEIYRRIPFILDVGGPSFTELFPFLDNPSFTIPAADRPRYHALCVMAGNFSTLLWQKLFDDLESDFGIPHSAAHPYLARAAANLQTDAGRALTGPLMRGDVATIEANLAALEGDPFHDIYQSFVRAHERRS